MQWVYGNLVDKEIFRDKFWREKENCEMRNKNLCGKFRVDL